MSDEPKRSLHCDECGTDFDAMATAAQICPQCQTIVELTDDVVKTFRRELNTASARRIIKNGEFKVISAGQRGTVGTPVNLNLNTPRNAAD